MADVKVQNKKKDKQLKVKKSKKGRVGKVILVIILFVVLAAGVACFYLDVGAIRTKTAEFIMPKKSEIEELSEREENQRLFEQQQEQIAQAKLELEEKETEITKRDTALVQAEQDYQARSATLDSRQKSLDSREQSVRNVARIYEDMDAEVAARILMSYEDKNEVSKIMKMLSDQQAADILSEMDTKYASGLLRIADEDDTPVTTGTKESTETTTGNTDVGMDTTENINTDIAEEGEE